MCAVFKFPGPFVLSAAKMQREQGQLPYRVFPTFPSFSRGTLDSIRRKIPNEVGRLAIPLSEDMWGA